MTPPEQSGVDRADDFFAGASGRIRRFFIVLAVAAAALLLPLQGRALAAGFAIGALVAYANLAQLERAVGIFAARAAGQGSDSGAGAGVRHLARYGGVAIVGYVIFRVSRTALFGFVGGLFVPIGAMVCEAGYEAWYTLRRRA
jgi:hypothetical protein